MAKKKRAQNDAPVPQTEESILPQNILAMGEHVEENKKIYISQSAYKAIHCFTKGKTVNESGGFLIGDVVMAFGETNIMIHGFVEAKHCESTPTTLKFTHETWAYCHKEVEKKYDGKKILGWIHTHPNFGLTLSAYDKFIQESFFKEEYNIAYVIDPIQKTECFYFWINGVLERSKGFFVFAETGTKITVAADGEKEDASVHQPADKNSLFHYFIISVLGVAIIVLLFMVVSLNSKVTELETQQQNMALTLEYQISGLEQEITELQDAINGSDAVDGDASANAQGE